MFDEYAKKLASVQADVPKIFKKVAKKAAIKFVNEAQDITDLEELVDTGNYKRNWDARAEEFDKNIYGVVCTNDTEYASHLEEGHKLKNGKRWKGRFVGRRALDEARYYCIKELDKEFDKAFTEYHQSFTEPE